MAKKRPLGPLQQRWVDALRSGEYQQGRGVLHTVRNNTWCCLGVACDLFAQEAGVEREGNEFGIEGFDGSYSLPPKSICELLKLRSDYGNYGNGSLAHDNDDKQKSFPEIADIIEANAYLLFTGPA